MSADVLVDALATYRVTRLLVKDEITEPLRDAIEARSVHVEPSNARFGTPVPARGVFPGNVCACSHLRMQHDAYDACAAPGCPCREYETLRGSRVVDVQPFAFVRALLDCPWCTGVWVGFGIRLVPRWVRRALAVAAVAGLLSEWVQTLDQVGDAAEGKG